MAISRNLSLSALMLTITWVNISPAISASDDLNFDDADPKADMAADVAEDALGSDNADQSEPVVGGDDIISKSEDLIIEDKEDNMPSSNAKVSAKLKKISKATKGTKQKSKAKEDDQGKPIGDAEDAESASKADSSPDVHSRFNAMHHNMLATHPESAKKFQAEYHASKDKNAVLAKWSKTAIESQDMLDAVDELFAIYQVLRNIDAEAADVFEQRVQDETDPRNLLEYAHKLLLKTLKERKSQIEAAKSELASISVILEYVDPDKAKEVAFLEKNAEDPREQLEKAYEILVKSLESAHAEAGLSSLE